MSASIKLLCASVLFIAKSLGQSCQPLTDWQKSQLEGFVKSWYRLPIEQTIALTDSSRADPACYRRLVFRASVPAPLLILYLTPDGKHLVNSVMDLTVDPIITRRKVQKEMEGRLSDGALLTSGPSDAPVRIVLFSDFQCPYCKRFSEIVSGLSPDERTKLQVTYRQLPLSIHPWAQDAAVVSTCAALQDKTAFWKLHDFFFAKQQELSKETVMTKALEFLAQERNVDRKKVESCLAENGYKESLQRDEQLAMDLGIAGTPTVFINGRKVSIRSVENLRAAIRSAEAEDRQFAAAAQEPK